MAQTLYMDDGTKRVLLARSHDEALEEFAKMLYELLGRDAENKFLESVDDAYEHGHETSGDHAYANGHDDGFKAASPQRAKARFVPVSNKPDVRVGMKCSLCNARVSYRDVFSGTHRFCYKCGVEIGGGDNNGN